MEKNLQDTFLSLVRLGIGHSLTNSYEAIDWQGIQTLAMEHGLYAIVLDGIEELPLSARPPQEFLLEWIGEVFQDYEYRYEQYTKAISELAGFYNNHGYKMMVLKGYACSLDWPKPSHRPCGDIDIWQFGKQKEADEALLKANTNRTDKTNHFSIDTSHHHHTVFNWGEFAVENHYDFINVYHHKSHAKLEKIFKKLGTFKVESGEFSVDSLLKGCSIEGCKIPSIEVYGEKVYLPSPNLHALFLLKHTMLHFVSGEITLRQLLDWAFFVERHTKEIDWGWLEKTLDEYGMMPLYQLFNAICVEDLGFSCQLFPSVQFNPSLKDKVLAEILMPDQVSYNKLGGIPRLINRFLRWKDSAWKHELCYKESMWSAFWYGVWGHLLKPASI